MWTVLIVDDYEPFRRLARRLLEAHDFRVVGEAADGASAAAASGSLHPDIVLLDVELPDTNGFALADRLAQEADGPLVVLTSSYTARDLRACLAHTSALGFVPKSEFSGEALAALVSRPLTRSTVKRVP